MISKERLQELIKEEATIYVKNGAITRLDYFEHFVEDDALWRRNKIVVGKEYCLKELFETKEEIEWELEFGNITRTETLKLPSWEEFDELKFKRIWFASKNYTFYALYQRYNKLYLDWSCDDDYYRHDRQWLATKENYIEACRLCKKLFIGDEV